MKKKRDSGGGGGGANWMDTYGDMVTLLMCFFILMYSMSSVDQEKYAAIAESFNPDAKDSFLGDTAEETPPPAPEDTVTEEQSEQNLEQLYEDLVDFFIEEDLGSNVSISKGSGYVFISFHDALFFAGNSYTISDEGQEILDNVAQAIGKISNTVNVIEVLGHTARADASDANIVSTDRFLASNRATAVTIYLQLKNIIEPSRLVSLGYGEWRPIGDNAISEEQATNRRVELVVSGYNEDNINKDDVDIYYNMQEDAQTAIEVKEEGIGMTEEDEGDEAGETQSADAESQTQEQSDSEPVEDSEQQEE